LKFEGTFEAPASPPQVWGLLTSPDKFGRAIPDLKKLIVNSQSSFYAEFPVKMGFLGGTIKMNFNYENLEPPSRMTLVGRGTGVQSTVDLTIGLGVESSGAGSKLSWTANLVVGGLIGSVGGGLMEGFAKQKVEQIVRGIRTVLETAK
jgi:uncharacterized protein